MITLKCLAGLLLLFSAPGFGQPHKAEAPADYPSKPIRIVVGFTPGAGGNLAAGMVARAGPDGYQTSLWFGLLASSEVPRPIVMKLNREVVRILSEPEVRQRWAPIGIEPRPNTPEEFDRLIRDEAAAFSRIATAANIKVD